MLVDMRANGSRTNDDNQSEDIQAWGESLESEAAAGDVWPLRSSGIAPKIVLACSFGAEDVVLLDMVHRIDSSVPLFYLDTDFLFPETYATRDRVIERYELKPAQVIQVKSLLTPEQQAEQHGEALWTSNPDRCCELRKVEPLTRVLNGFDAWITGIRREQSPTRANAKLIEWDDKFQLVKVNPLASGRGTMSGPTSRSMKCRTTNCTTATIRALAVLIARSP